MPFVWRYWSARMIQQTKNSNVREVRYLSGLL